MASDFENQKRQIAKEQQTVSTNIRRTELELTNLTQSISGSTSKLRQEINSAVSMMEHGIKGADAAFARLAKRIQDLKINKDMELSLLSMVDSMRESSIEARNLNVRMENINRIEEHISEITSNFEKWKKLFKKDFKDAFVDIRQTFGENFKKNLMADDGFFKNISKSLKDIATDSETWLKITSAIVSEGWKLTNNIYSQQERFVKEIGATFKDTNETILKFYDKLAVSAARLGFSMEEMGAIAPALVKEFGTLNVLTEELSKDMLTISRSLGMDTVESVALFGTLMNKLGMASESTTKNFIAGTYELAKQTKVAPRAVLKQIEMSAKAIATWYKSGSKSIAETAIYATRLGTTMDNLSATAEGLVNFETSIEKEMETSVLLGRRFNLERARSLAFQGKLKDMNEEILRQVGGITKWDKMDWYQKKAIAESVNMTVEGLTEQLVKQKQTKEVMDKMKYGLSNPFEEAMKGTISFSDAMNELDKQGHLTQFKNGIMAIGQALASSLYPVLNAMLPILGDIGKALGTVAQWFSKFPVWAKTITGVSIAIGALGLAFITLYKGVKTIGMVSTALKTLGGATTVLSTSAGASTGGFFKGLATGLQSLSKVKPGPLLAIAGVILAISAATIGLAYAATIFAQAGWAGMGMMIISLAALVAAIWVLGALGTSGIGEIGVLLILALAGAMMAMAYSSKWFAESMDMLANSINSLANNIANISLLGMSIIGLATAFGVLFGVIGFGMLSVLAFKSLSNTIKDIADSANNLNVASTALQGISTYASVAIGMIDNLAESFDNLVNSVKSFNDEYKNFDIKKVKELNVAVNKQNDELKTQNNAILNKLEELKKVMEKGMSLHVDGTKLTYELERISTRGGGDRTFAGGIV